MRAVEGRDAVDEVALFGPGALVRHELDVDAELAQVVHDDGGVAQIVVVAPAPEQGGLSRAEKAAEDRDGGSSGGAHGLGRDA